MRFLAGAALIIAGALRDSGASTVHVQGSRLIVDGDPSFVIKGIAYSPVPAGQNGAGNGDFFLPHYNELWQRDLPLLRQMGANAVRVYHWLPREDHTPFLDAAHASGVRVIVTYDLTSAQFMPVGTAEQRQQIIGNFTEQVTRYKAHPALLMWCFGNELNGDWNGFVVSHANFFFWPIVAYGSPTGVGCVLALYRFRFYLKFAAGGDRQVVQLQQQ